MEVTTKDISYFDAKQRLSVFDRIRLNTGRCRHRLKNNNNTKRNVNFVTYSSKKEYIIETLRLTEILKLW